MEPVKTTLQKLKPFIGRKADSLWVRYNTGDRDEKQEWTQVINLLAEKHKINTIDEDIVLPPPQKEELGGEITLGRTQYLNQPSQEFGLNLSELTRHIGIFGSTGTGKTTLAKNILRELMKLKIPFIVFDWEKNYRDLLKENQQVKIFTIGTGTSPFYFNYFKMPRGISYEEHVKNIIEIFNKAYIGGAGSDSILLQVFDEAYQENELPTTEDAQQILASDMKGKKLRGREMLWKQSSMRMLQFLNYGGTGKVYNVKDHYPIEKLLNDCVIFELGGLANSNDKRFFIEMFTLLYWLQKEQEGIEDENLKHVLVFEEFHNIVENSKKDDLIQKIFRQIRKYGTSLIIIDQTPSLIPNPIFENLYTKITFSLNHKKNVDAIADAMSMDREQRKYIGMLKIGQAICRLMGRCSHPFQLSIPFKKASQNIPDAEVKGQMEDFYKDYSPKRTPLPQKEPLHTPTERFTPSPLERIFLEDILTHPFDGADQRGKRLGLIPRDSAKLQNTLIEKGIITPITIDKKKLFELTERGEHCLQKSGRKTDSKERNQGLEHRYFLEKIRQAKLPNNWFPFKEKGDIDLVLEKEEKVIAIEIETGKNKPEQTIKNLEKLIKFRADKKFMIATNDEAFAKIKNLLSESKLPDKDSIQIIHIREFLKNLPA
ncbi:MAG: ATP-binding protein [Deltaproteobacteria bacterium]|nr:ATP-binding protein [Deltaproteobacteria bacterium]